MRSGILPKDACDKNKKRGECEMQNRRLREGLLILGVYAAVVLAMVFAEDLSLSLIHI